MSPEPLSATLKPEFSAFLDAWQNARKQNALPKRADIRLQEFAPFAESMQIFELKSPTDLRCRLMGSQVSERVSGINPEDNVFDFFEPQKRSIAQSWWQTMADKPCGGLSRFSVAYPNGSKRMIETIVLPVLGKRVKSQFIVYSNKPEFVDSAPQNDRLVLGGDDYQLQFIDVGFGKPSD